MTTPLATHDFDYHLPAERIAFKSPPRRPSFRPPAQRLHHRPTLDLHRAQHDDLAPRRARAGPRIMTWWGRRPVHAPSVACGVRRSLTLRLPIRRAP